MATAIYPGSFDPITKGHIDIIERAAKYFDNVVVGVLVNKNKHPMFSLVERVNLIEEAIAHLDNVKIDSFDGLLVNYMEKKNISIIVKGLRAVSDFENEFQMATMNRKLSDKVETFFLMTDMKFAHLSSSLVKEVFLLNGDISDCVPGNVIQAMNRKRGEFNEE